MIMREVLLINLGEFLENSLFRMVIGGSGDKISEYLGIVVVHSVISFIYIICFRRNINRSQ